MLISAEEAHADTSIHLLRQEADRVRLGEVSLSLKNMCPVTQGHDEV